MKNVVLASLLAASASAYTVTTVGSGPVHFRITQPHSVTAVVPYGGGPNTATFPTTPLQFVITDMTWSQTFSLGGFELKANGNTVFVGGQGLNHHISLNTGILIPAGATLTATATGAGGSPQTLLEAGLCLSGYVQ